MSESFNDNPTKIRVDEGLNKVALANYLSNFLDIDKNSFEILQFPSGFSNLTYLIKSNKKEFILRKPPIGAKVKSGHDMSREYKVLSALKTNYKKSPTPIHYCDEVNIIGSDFYIMERISGIVLRSNNFKKILTKKAQYNFIAFEFVNTLVELHKLQIEKIGLSEFGRPVGYCERQVNGWIKRYQNSKTHDIPEINFVMKWLNNNIKESPYVSLIHNDFKYDNLVLDPKNLSVKSVLDWEMCTTGDPFMDLGTTLAYWINKDDPDYMREINLNITSDKNNPKRGEILEMYSKKFGDEIENIVFYFVFGLFKIAVIVQQIYFRYEKGLTKDIRFKHLNLVVQSYARMAKESIESEKIES
jgi:aminoglycoside phosphotransferase (APT) family kinase protein